MSNEIPIDLGKKLRLLLAAIDSGVVCPDPLELAAAAHILKEHGELALSREYERRARRFFPQLRRDLS
jgi:hypothetical protein